MSDCRHPRSQGYTDERGRDRCGACGDVWVQEVWPKEDGTHYGDFLALDENDEPIIPLAARRSPELT